MLLRRHGLILLLSTLLLCPGAFDRVLCLVPRPNVPLPTDDEITKEFAAHGWRANAQAGRRPRGRGRPAPPRHGHSTGLVCRRAPRPEHLIADPFNNGLGCPPRC
jgi:hypothetical protein